MNSGGINDSLSLGGSSTGRSEFRGATRGGNAECVLTDLCLGGAHLMGSDLYKHLNGYFVNHLKMVRAVRCSSLCARRGEG